MVVIKSRSCVDTTCKRKQVFIVQTNPVMVHIPYPALPLLSPSSLTCLVQVFSIEWRYDFQNLAKNSDHRPPRSYQCNVAVGAKEQATKRARTKRRTGKAIRMRQKKKKDIRDTLHESPFYYTVLRLFQISSGWPNIVSEGHRIGYTETGIDRPTIPKQPKQLAPSTGFSAILPDS
ncbi:hypothetical protein PCH_Pc16g14500 [Penicillium rubens Wisconsin 54-1255]|uniref:Uncharacterized protein n=1 Tax=Penicillium rubens (strain ATCC 28089 / DSM 1075 / NRRL 1951 / Wisconsin 54-1255) TaxID=500485 RepID=B6H9Z6_PENRW|nr:hypothetical protein PCH_Pc16g14500 [Penicillium rubens Wisconsin 54-1255]